MIDNINPTIWGKYGWKFLHYITFAYPNNPSEEEKKNILNFFTNIGFVLPCEKCRIHYQTNLKKFPLTPQVLETKYNLINWLLNMHNQVSIWNGKTPWTYQQLLDEYDVNKSFMCVEIVTVILLILMLIIIIVYVKFFRK